VNAVALQVLLVEDSPSDAALVQEAVAEAEPGRFAFTLVESWAAAHRQLQSGQFDVVLLDLSLPDSSGSDTFRRARQAAGELPIVVMSGLADEAVSLEAMRQGIQDYLLKGRTDGPGIVRALRYAIERRRGEVALQRTEAALRESERQLRETNEALERRVAERTARLEETIRDLKELSYTLVHDLRAPLRAMSMCCQMLRDECQDCKRPAAQDYTRRIVTSAVRMDRLVQDVLQYSRLAESELALEPVDLGPLLHGIIESYPNLHADGVKIEVLEPLPRVLGNTAALTQCFSNLLGNAVKFVAPGVTPQIRVRAEQARPTSLTSPTGRTIRLWVEDNGIGIPKRAHERIFKLFQRMDPAYEGDGVGLTIVHKAVERMGGKVGVESEPGQGSRFWLELKAL
jgi:signal transduction histidine kinase